MKSPIRHTNKCTRSALALSIRVRPEPSLRDIPIDWVFASAWVADPTFIVFPLELEPALHLYLNIWKGKGKKGIL